MTSSTAILPSVRAAFAGLIDYAGLFPPAALPLAAAQNEYRSAQGGPQDWMLGRFIIRCESLEVLAEPFGAPLSVIVKPDAQSLARAGELRRRGMAVEALEIPLERSEAPHREHLSADEMLDIFGAIETDRGVNGLADLAAFVEIPRARPWWNSLSQTMESLARLQLRAKLRCGGVTANAFPNVDEVTDFIAAAASAKVAFKATAGLHHPVRHLDEKTGFTMHGFLNIVAAAAFAPRVSRATLASIVAEEDAGAFSFEETSFAWRGERIGAADLADARRNAFISYGSCSFSEPVEDLTALALLPPA